MDFAYSALCIVEQVIHLIALFLILVGSEVN